MEQYVGHRYRAYPDKEQQELLAKTFGCVRFVWNNILDWRSKEYTLNKTKIGYATSAKKLTEIKQIEEYKWLKDVSNVALQQSLRNQDVAFSRFFRKLGKYPVFKDKHGAQSFRLTTGGFRFKNGKLYIAKSEIPLSLAISRDMPTNIKSIVVSKDSSGRYFVSLQGVIEKENLPTINKTIGVDMGLTHFAITSDGEKIDNPRFLKQQRLRLERAQRKVSRCIKDSNNRTKAKLAVAIIHSKVTDARNDFQHKLSTRLIRENQTITVEDLNINGMVKNRHLSRAINDVAWGGFIKQLEYKSLWYGRTLVKVNPWFPSSQICSVCGHRGENKSLRVRIWTCSECGINHDRDINAANNLNTAGLAEIQACQI